MKKYFNRIKSLKIASLLKASCYWAFFLILLIMVSAQSGATLSSDVRIFVYGVLGPAIALLVAWILIKLERKSFADYGLVWARDTFLKFFKGLAIGASGFLVITLILVLFTDLTIHENPAWTVWILFWYLPIIPLALMEEIAFRSYPFLALNKAFGLWVTQIIVSIAFALYHVLIGWNVSTAFLGPGIWSFVFGIAAIRSNGVALPTGIHAGLNITLSLYGMGNGECEPIWIAKQSENDSNDVVGLITRIVVLIVGIFLTERYISSKQKRNQESLT